MAELADEEPAGHKVPLFGQCTAVCSFGIMPPLMMPSLTVLSAELGVMRR